MIVPVAGIRAVDERHHIEAGIADAERVGDAAADAGTRRHGADVDGAGRHPVHDGDSLPGEIDGRPAVAADLETTLTGSPRSAFTANAFENTNDVRIAVAANRLIVVIPKIDIFITVAPNVAAPNCGSMPPAFL